MKCARPVEIINMFRPSLKRSRQTPLGLKTPLSAPAQEPVVVPDPRSPTEIYDSNRKQLMPTSFFSPDPPPEQPTTNYLFTPLNFEWRPYHRAMQRMIDTRLQAPACNRGIGNHDDLMWYFQDDTICLWNRRASKQVTYSLPRGTDCVQLGQLQSSSLHFKSTQLYILAVAVGNNLVLYGIEKDSLNKTDLKFCKTLAHSRYIQLIKFISRNEIVAASDTGRYLHIDFTAEAVISQQRQSLLERSMPYMPLLFPSVNLFVEDVQVSGDMVFALIREERKANWFSVKARQIAARFVSTRGHQQIIIETRRISVMRLDRKNRNIKPVDSIKQEDILSQISGRCPQMDLLNFAEEYKIVSIYVERKKGQEDKLGVVTKNGYFVSLNKQYLLSLHRDPLNAVRQCNVGPVGFFMEKKIESSAESRRSLRVFKSLGLDNLTATEDALWFLSDGVTESVQCEGGIGQFCSYNSRNDCSDTAWIAFGREGFYLVSRVTPRKAFLGYLACSSELVADEPDKSWRDETNFSMFLDTFSKTVGYQKVCELLIEYLQAKKLTLRLNSWIRAMIKEELRGNANKDYRDWSYDINSRGDNWQVELTPAHIEQIRRLLFQYQNKPPKNALKNLTAKGIHCSAYWYALRNLFVKAAGPILQLKPTTIKPNLKAVEEAIHSMDSLAHFIADKKNREARVLKDCLTHRYSRQGKQKKDAWRMKAQFTHETKKEQNDTTFDSLPAPVPAHLTESSTTLQQTILINTLKVKHYVTMFMYLAELSSNFDLPTILEVMRSKRSQLRVKQYLLQRVEDREKLAEFNNYLPELQIWKDLRFCRWKQYQEKYNLADYTNLAEVATFATSQNYPTISTVFKERFDLQIDLLQYYQATLQGQLAAVSKEHGAGGSQVEQQSLYAQEQEGLLQQKRSIITEQLKFVRQKIEECVNQSIKAYLESNETNYPAAQKQINSIICNVTRHDEHSVTSLLEMQLSTHGLAEKLILLRSKRKQTVPAPSVEERLGQRVGKQPRVQQRREHLSTFEAMLMSQ